MELFLNWWILNKRPFLNNIYQTVYLQDIITRNNITNDFAVRLILKKIAESVTKALSFNRLTNIVKSAGVSIGKQTVINYVGHMLDSYLIFSLQNTKILFHGYWTVGVDVVGL